MKILLVDIKHFFEIPQEITIQLVEVMRFIQILQELITLLAVVEQAILSLVVQYLIPRDLILYF